MTMTLVSTVEVGAGGASSISFTGIPQTGTDLMLALSLRDTGTYSLMTFTIVPNSSYGLSSGRMLLGNGSASSSSTNQMGYYPGSDQTANTFGNANVYIPNYSGSTTKTLSVDAVQENNATTSFANIFSGLWNSTNAITSISLGATAASFAQYSTVSLYTITKGSGGATIS